MKKGFSRISLLSFVIILALAFSSCEQAAKIAATSLAQTAAGSKNEKQPQKKVFTYTCSAPYGQFKINWMQADGKYDPLLVIFSPATGKALNEVKKELGKSYSNYGSILHSDTSSVGNFFAKWVEVAIITDPNQITEETTVTYEDYYSDTKGANYQIKGIEYDFQESGTLDFTIYAQVDGDLTMRPCTVSASFTQNKIDEYTYEIDIKKSDAVTATFSE
jgi:hypothetical protein